MCKRTALSARVYAQTLSAEKKKTSKQCTSAHQGWSQVHQKCQTLRRIYFQPLEHICTIICLCVCMCVCVNSRYEQLIEAELYYTQHPLLPTQGTHLHMPHIDLHT